MERSLLIIATNAGCPARAKTITRTNVKADVLDTTPVDPNSEATADFSDTTPPPDPVIDYPESTPTPDAAGAPLTNVSLVKNYGGHWSIVGNWFSNVSAVNADFAYSQEVGSEIGVGYSATGKFGSFSMSGTHSESSTGTQGFNTVRGTQDMADRTLFTYKLYRYDNCTKACLPPTYKAFATSWRGGADQQNIGHPSGIGSCVPEPNGSYFNRVGMTAINWTNGVAIAGAIGIDLSIKTNYTTEAHLDIRFNGDRSLCGRGSYPGQNPYVLMARPWSASH